MSDVRVFCDVFLTSSANSLRLQLGQLDDVVRQLREARRHVGLVRFAIRPLVLIFVSPSNPEANPASRGRRQGKLGMICQEMFQVLFPRPGRVAPESVRR